MKFLTLTFCCLASWLQASGALTLGDFPEGKALGPEVLVLRAGQDYRSQDWSGYGLLRLEVSSSSGHAVRLEVTLKGPQTDEEGKPALFGATLDGWESTTWQIPILYLPYTRSKHRPEQEHLSDIEQTGFSSLTQVAFVEIHALGEGGKEVRLTRLELDGPHPKTGWLDRFGQRCCVDWPGKIHSDGDLVRADQAEVVALAKMDTPAGRDEYQAWTERPARKATGFFRLEKVDGRWWFIAPNGHLYYSQGLDCVLPGGDARLDKTTRPAFSWLPPQPKGGEGGAWVKAQPGIKDVEPFWPSMWRANLIRKWGEKEALERWRLRTLERLKVWGFTGMGNWSDPGNQAIANWYLDQKLSSTPTAKTWSFPYFTMGPHYWDSYDKVRMMDRFQDVFDPAFLSAVTQASANLAAFKDDPWVVGHFIENELPWWQLPPDMLRAPLDEPARVWFVGLLKKKYGSVMKLNRAWGTQAKDFDSLRWPDWPHAAAKADMGLFMAEFAERWYAGWAKAMRQADPHHLCLGDRYMWLVDWPQIVEACGRHMDLISINYYAYAPPLKELKDYSGRTGKPILIGEYDFDSLDAGLLSTAIPVASQEERGVGYRSYTEAVAAAPFMVGAHYFQYGDEPVTGRFDRETSFNGFVAVTDIPYPALVEAARKTNARIYGLHAGVLEPYEGRPAK
jgi:hypothetical protein